MSTFIIDHHHDKMPDSQKDFKEINSALLESEQRLKSIIDAAVDGIITIDIRGNIQSINPAALKLFQYKEDDVLGENIKKLMPEPDRGRHDGYLKNYHDTGKAKIIGIGRQVLGQKKDGKTFPFRLSISEVNLKSGKIYTGIVHDLSEEVKAKKELVMLNDSLEEMVQERTQQLESALKSIELTNESLSNEIKRRKRKELEVRQLLDKEIELGALKSRFVSMASHEFRTPLTGILSAASLIDRYQTTEQAVDRSRLTGLIRTSVGNLTNILNDFLSMDKLQSGKVTINRSQFEFQELLDEVIDELTPTITEGQIIQKNIAAIPGGISLDRNILKNILLNLLSNAIKYSKAEGRIEIKTIGRGQNLEIEIRDDGIGIPEVDQKHMFERFFRAHNVTNIKGTGLGLNIVKRYLDMLEGEISFTSKEGIGTTFSVRIPIY